MKQLDLWNWLPPYVSCCPVQTHIIPLLCKGALLTRRLSMKLRFYHDPESGQPHIYKHSVSETEVGEVLMNPGEDRQGAEGSRVATGQTESGRYLRVIYVPDPEPGSVFVITAYQLKGQALTAYRRRRRRRRGKENDNR